MNKRLLLIMLTYFTFIGCANQTTLNLDLTIEEQNFYKSVESELALDSLSRILLKYPLTYSEVEIDYWVNLYLSEDIPRRSVVEKQAYSIVEFVSTQPVRAGKIVTCIIVFYKKGDELGETSFSFKISENGYMLNNKYLDETLLD